MLMLSFFPLTLLEQRSENAIRNMLGGEVCRSGKKEAKRGGDRINGEYLTLIISSHRHWAKDITASVTHGRTTNIITYFTRFNFALIVAVFAR